VSGASLKDDIPEGHQKAEVLRAKQDMMNRIIQMEEKVRSRYAYVFIITVRFPLYAFPIFLIVNKEGEGEIRDPRENQVASLKSSPQEQQALFARESTDSLTENVDEDTR